MGNSSSRQRAQGAHRARRARRAPAQGAPAQGALAQLQQFAHPADAAKFASPYTRLPAMVPYTPVNDKPNPKMMSIIPPFSDEALLDQYEIMPEDVRRTIHMRYGGFHYIIDIGITRDGESTIEFARISWGVESITIYGRGLVEHNGIVMPSKHIAWYGDVVQHLIGELKFVERTNSIAIYDYSYRCDCVVICDQ